MNRVRELRIISYITIMLVVCISDTLQKNTNMTEKLRSFLRYAFPGTYAHKNRHERRTIHYFQATGW